MLFAFLQPGRFQSKCKQTKLRICSFTSCNFITAGALAEQVLLLNIIGSSLTPQCDSKSRSANRLNLSAVPKTSQNGIDIQPWSAEFYSLYQYCPRYNKCSALLWKILKAFISTAEWAMWSWPPTSSFPSSPFPSAGVHGYTPIPEHQHVGTAHVGEQPG